MPYVSPKGQVIGIVNNNWGAMDFLARFIGVELRENYGAADVIEFKNAHRKGGDVPPEFLDEVAAKVAGAITGLGN